MRYARVRNWEKFQHYKDRNPPWVKLYTSWPEDYEWSQWSDASKLLAVCILMLASRSGNRIPLDPKWMQQRFSLQRPPDLAPLIAVQFLEEIQELQTPEQNASTLLADCKHDASLRALAREEESREEERRDRGETEGAGAPGLDAVAWERWRDYREQIRKPIKPVSMQAAQRELAGFGCDQSTVVERSIAAGWQGLFPLKQRPNGAKKPHQDAPTTEELEAREAARARS
jgi:hypothetical protein